MTYFRSLLICLALIGFAVSQANAQGTAQVQNVTVLPLVTTNFPPPGADPAALPPAPFNLTFQKSGRQASCDYVSIVARLQLDFQPGLLGDPQFLASVSDVRFDFADTLPAGLHVERVHLSGDILAIPATINQTAGNPADVSIVGIQFDPAALTLTQSTLSFEVAIDARIDRAAFAAPSTVDTQAMLAISTSYGPYATMASNDMAYPEDGDQINGQPTTLAVDITGCPDIAQTVAAGTPGSTTVSGGGVSTPGSSTVIVGVGGTKAPVPIVPPAGGDLCFKLIEGEISCSTNGTYVYRMPVGPEMAGKTVSFASQTPGVWVDMPSQVVPVGGATLEWTVYGAQPGMTLSFEVTGETSYKGPAEGWGLCCTRLIEIVVPVGDCPEPPPPPLIVEKSPENCPIGATECTFRMTVTNPGPNAYTGPIALVDNFTLASGGVSLAAPPAAPWQCSSPTTPMFCAHPAVTLQSGEALSLDLAFTGLTPEQRNAAVNCAHLDIGLTGATLPGFKLLSASDCVYAYVPEEPVPPADNDQPKLTIAKVAEEPNCTSAGECYFGISITNSGGANYSGPISFIDQTLPGFGSDLHIGGVDFACTASGTDGQACTSTQDINLPAGATMRFASWVKVDPATLGRGGFQSVSNCASLQAITGVADTTESCAEMGLPPTPPADTPPAPVKLVPRAPAPLQPAAVPPPPVSSDGPTAPVKLVPRAPAPLQPAAAVPPPPISADAPPAPVLLVPRTPAPVGGVQPPAPVQLQPRQPQGNAANEPGAPVVLVPRVPTSAPTAAPNNCPATMVMSANGNCACPPGTVYDVRKRICSGAAAVQTPRAVSPPVAVVPSVRPASKAKPQTKTKQKKLKKQKPKKQKQKQKKNNSGADAEAIGKILNGIGGALLGGGGGCDPRKQECQ